MYGKGLDGGGLGCEPLFAPMVVETVQIKSLYTGTEKEPSLFTLTSGSCKNGVVEFVQKKRSDSTLTSAPGKPPRPPDN